MVQLLGGYKQIIEGGRNTMTYTSKEQYINALIRALTRCGVTDTREILTDFEQHFADGAAAGETEEQTCVKLGDPEEIAEQYISEGFQADSPEQTASASGFGADPFGGASAQQTQQAQTAQTIPPVQQAAQTASFSPDSAAIVGILCVDIFVFSWTLPTLMSIIIAFYSCVAGLFFAGLGVFIGGVALGIVGSLTWLTTSFSAVSTALLGVVLASGALLLTGACVAAGRGFVNICISIINWHSRVFAGKNVLNKIGKKYRNKQTAA